MKPQHYAENKLYIIRCEICGLSMELHPDKGACVTTTIDGYAGSCRCVTLFEKLSRKQTTPDEYLKFLENLERDGFSEQYEAYLNAVYTPTAEEY